MCVCSASRECEQYARHMTKPDPKDGSTLNFNSPEEQEAVEVVFQNAITPLAEVGKFTALPHGISSYHLQFSMAIMLVPVGLRAIRTDYASSVQAASIFAAL